MSNTPYPARRFASEATITIHNLRLRTFIGFNPDETTKKQDVVINIELDYAVTIDKPHALRFADSVSLALEYRAGQTHQLRLLEKAS